MKQLLLFIFTRLLLAFAPKCYCRSLFAWRRRSSRVPRCLNRRGGGDQRCSRFLGIYHRVASSRAEDTDLQDDSISTSITKWFWNSSVAFCVVYDACRCRHRIRRRDDHGGRTQNLIIAKAAGWHFGDFFLRIRR